MFPISQFIFSSNVGHPRTFSRHLSSLARSLARGDDSLNRIPLATANLASSRSLSLLPSFDRSAANPTERAARAASYTHCKGDFFTQWQADQYFKCLDVTTSAGNGDRILSLRHPDSFWLSLRSTWEREHPGKGWSWKIWCAVCCIPGQYPMKNPGNVLS